VAESRHRSLHEKSNDAVMTLDPPSWQFTSANPSAIAMFGARDEADFVSRAPCEYSAERQPDGPDSAGLVQEIGEAAVRDGSRVIEWTCARLDGTDFPATIVLTRIECAGETILKAMVTDISLEKRTEAERETRLVRQEPVSLLQPSRLTPTPLDRQVRRITDASERFASSIEDALSAHVAILDETGTIIAVNRAWREFAAANPPVETNVFEGANYLQVCDTADGSGAEEAVALAAGIRAVMRDQQPSFALEYPCHSPQEKRWFVARVTRFAGDGPIRIVVAHENVTDRKQAEDALRIAELRYRSLYEQSRDALMTLDPSSLLYISVNPSAIAMFGARDEADFVSRGPWQYSPELQPNGRNSSELAKEIGEAAVREGTRLFEWTHARIDGTVFPTTVLLNRIECPGKRFLHATVRDITLEKRMEAERETRLLRQEGISLLEQSLLTPAPLDQKLKKITDTVVRLFDADFCRIWLIRSGDRCAKGCMHAEVLEGPHLCRDRTHCLHLVSSSGRYTHTDGEVHRRVPLGCYKIGEFASWDEHRITINDVQKDPNIHDREWARTLGLVSYAAYQLRAPGGKTLGVLALFSKHPIPAVELAMLDGLSSTAALCVQLAVAEEELQESNNRYNALFDNSLILVHIVDFEGRVIDANDATFNHLGYTRQEIRSLEAILVVDDNATNRRILDELLTHWGMKPTVVEGGRAALAAVKQASDAGEPYPLVLLDAMMPEMDGFAVAEQIQQAPELAETAVMMLSSADRLGDAEHCRALGIAAYLRKPVKASELFNSILDVLGVAPMARFEPSAAVPDALPQPSRRLRVLLTEDNRVNQRLAITLLEDRGHTVVVANDGREALEILDRESFDLILMDVQMPRMDGFQATAAIRAAEDGSKRRTRILALTAHAMKGDQERCLAAGMDGYITKPIRPEQFLAAVEGRNFTADRPEPAAGGDARPGVAGEVFDLREALARARGKRDLLRKMAELFLADCPGLLTRIRSALAANDESTLERAAHRMKGAAANLSAARVVGVARRLEEIARQGHLAEANATRVELEDEVVHLEHALEILKEEGVSCGP